MATKEEIKDALWAAFKDSFGGVFTKAEDLKAAEEIITEQAAQRFTLLTGTEEEKADAKFNLEGWENVIANKIHAKQIKVTKGSEKFFTSALAFVGKLLGGVVGGALGIPSP